MLDSGRLHMVLERDRFASDTPIVPADDPSSASFALHDHSLTPPTVATCALWSGGSTPRRLWTKKSKRFTSP